MCMSEVALAVSGDRAHRHRRLRGEASLARDDDTNIPRLSATMLQAKQEVLHGHYYSGFCDADAGVRYLDGMLGKGVLFMQDPAKNKVNNLLFHLKRLVTEELEKGGPPAGLGGEAQGVRAARGAVAHLHAKDDRV